MKTYTLTEVIELFKTFDRKYTANINSDYWYKTFIEANSPTEEVGIKKDDSPYKKVFGIDVPSDNNNEGASLASHTCTIDNSIRQWETFCDSSYYDLWAVRPIGDIDFNSQKLFHVQSMEEAYALRDILNSK